VEHYKKQLDEYARSVGNLANEPIPTNPKEPYLESLKLPEPPKFNFNYLLKEKEHQEKLQSNLQEDMDVYKTLLIDYRENEAKAKYISERFGKGRILKEM